MLIALLAVPGVDLIVMVLVWTKAPLLFRTELVPPDGLESSVLRVPMRSSGSVITRS
jgi:hypothetical protein